MSGKSKLLEGNAETASEIEHRYSDTNASATDSTAQPAIQREQIFEILSNERRQLVLQYLRKRNEDGQVEFRELVDQVAAWENDTTIREVDSSDRKCVYTALRQTHLPKLDAFGVIEFDHQRGSLEPKENLGEVIPYMEYSPGRETFWNRVYLLLAAVCVLSVLLLIGGFVPFGSGLQVAVTIGVASAFGITSFAQLYRSNQAEIQPTDPNRR